MAGKKQYKVLVTGASGFTGHHMVAEAVKAGFKVRATDVSSRHYGAMFEALDVEFVKSDLTKQAGLDSLVKGMDAVIHVAGIHNYSVPDEIIFAINATAVKNLCEAAVNAGVDRFMHFSSVGVYGYSSNPGNLVAEDHPKITPPLNNYNLSKWEGEQHVWDYIENRGLKATIFRPAAIYGTRSEYGLFNVFQAVYNDRNKQKMLMIGKGDKIEAFLHVEDMCKAVIYAFDNDSMIGEAYNVSDDTRMATVEFFNLVSRELLGVEKEFLNIPTAVLKPVAGVAQFLGPKLGLKPILERGTLDYMSCDKLWDNRKLKKTGFQFKYPTMEKGMKETIAWYKENGWFKL